MSSIKEHNQKVAREVASLQGWIDSVQHTRDTMHVVSMKQVELCDTMLVSLKRRLDRTKAMILKED